jgi:glutamyl-tRNA synthetase
METPAEKLSELVMPFLVKDGLIKEGNPLDNAWLCKAIETLKERSKTLIELAASLRYYIAEDVEYDEKAKKKFLNEKSLDLLIELKGGLESAADFTEAELGPLFKSIVEKHDTKLGKLAQPVRVAVTGGTASPGIFDVLEVLGKEKTIRRLDKAIEAIKVL